MPFQDYKQLEKNKTLNKIFSICFIFGQNIRIASILQQSHCQGKKLNISFNN